MKMTEKSYQVLENFINGWNQIPSCYRYGQDMDYYRTFHSILTEKVKKICKNYQEFINNLEILNKNNHISLKYSHTDESSNKIFNVYLITLKLMPHELQEYNNLIART